MQTNLIVMNKLGPKSTLTLVSGQILPAGYHFSTDSVNTN